MTDLVTRLLRAGRAGRYDPAPAVAHHHGRRRADDVAALLAAYDRGRGAYYAKLLQAPDLRRAVAGHWLRAIRYQPLSITWRELTAACSFLRVGNDHAP